MDVAVDRTERAVELVGRAANLGLRAEFQNGLTVILKRTASADEEESVDDCLREIMKYLPEVRSILKQRAVAAVARKHAGSQIFSEYGAGTLVGASDNGLLTIKVNQGIGSRSQISVTASAESLFLILDDEAEADGALPAADRKPELVRKRLLPPLSRNSAFS
jgi:hypothetical protein